MPLHNPLSTRLKLVHQLALLLLGMVLVAMAGVGGVVAWNLRSGFGDYLKARDDVQLDRFVQLLELRSAPDPSMGWLRGSRAAMEMLVEEFASVEGLERPPPRGPRPRPEGRPGLDERPPRPLASFAPPPPPPSPSRMDPAPAGGPVGSIAGRIQIFDAQGRWLAGREQPRGVPTVSRAVKVRGEQVATVKLTQEREPQGVDARFLQRQYGGLGIAIAVMLIFSLVLAWWAARRWVRPLQNLQHATRRMAAGDLGFQVPTLAPDQGTHEIAGLIDDVNSMSQALAKLESARRIWIAQISHELRTPLAVLRGEIESIEDGARQPTPDVLASLRDEVLQLTRLVNDLHTLSMADLGELPCTFASGDAHAFLGRVAQRFEARAAQRGLRLDILPDDTAVHGVPVCWDFGRIEQVLTNLLENSLRYTRAPGRVLVAWKKLGGHLVLNVEDTPPGMAPAQLPLLFEPLFRADAARSRSGHARAGGAGGGQDAGMAGMAGMAGSGLGLSIAQAIVKAHRGSIRASASGLGGLAVEVRLPLDAEGPP